ncbi:hypothetical protein CEXT_100251 [Caerostris extrusa]|uniref:Uncharacterized protein n=1 Tax=Caerostris extrusa TaxID=172846 RepID=A0AAV4P906_CAEEX|nr:hypothetical protein CEXT_100251 [Caerostris extrusa]
MRTHFNNQFHFVNHESIFKTHTENISRNLFRAAHRHLITPQNLLVEKKIALKRIDLHLSSRERGQQSSSNCEAELCFRTTTLSVDNWIFPFFQPPRFQPLATEMTSARKEIVSCSHLQVLGNV